jgi:F-type H+-transporting ATPase subunit delta
MTKRNGKVAKKYARALIGAYQPDQLDGVTAALDSVATTWEGSQELRDALSNPRVSRDERSQVLAAIAERIRPTDQLFKNTLLVVLENKRLTGLPEIATEFKSMVAALKKMLAVEISSAVEVSTSERTQLEQQLAKDFGSLSSVTWNTDSALIGGATVRAGDTVLDGSLAGALQRIKTELVA